MTRLRRRRPPAMTAVSVLLAFGIGACAALNDLGMPLRDLEYRPLSDEVNQPPPICRGVETKCAHYHNNLKRAKGQSNTGLELLRQDCEESRAACVLSGFSPRVPLP